jgi:hypothetical protein
MTDVLDTIPVEVQRDWLMRELNELMRSQGERVLETQHRHLWNSGVIVIDGDMVDRYFDPPGNPCPPFWCAEEHWCRGNIEKYGLGIYPLPREIHWCWHWDRDFEVYERTRPPFVHLAAMGQPIEGWEAPNRVWRERVLRILAASNGVESSVTLR